MAITLRAVTGSALSHNQVDTNFSSYFYSASLSGSTLDLHYTGSSAIGLLPRSTSISLPSGSKWTDISGGGISRNSRVQITGSTNMSGSTNIIGTFTQGFSGLQAFNFSHAEGYINIASGSYSHAEGNNTRTTGSYSHAEGVTTRAIGQGSHAEGISTIASGSNSHAEGNSTVSQGVASHAEGINTFATGDYSHAEGSGNEAIGLNSHAEGQDTQAIGDASHAEGSTTQARGFASHTEGLETIARGDYSHAEGLGTVTSGSYQHTQGQYNISSSAQSAFILGNGTSNANRSNLVFASGSEFQITGSLNVLGPINTVGNLVVQGDVTAQQYIVSTSVYYVTESYSSGSHIFGNSIDDTHQFTGSVLVSGSGTFANNLTISGSATLIGSMSIGSSTSNGSITVTAGSPFLLLRRGNDDTRLELNGGTTATSGSLNYTGGTFLRINSNKDLKFTTDDKERITVGINGGIIINSGSLSTAPTTLQVTGSTSLSGSLTINNGFDLIAHGNKQFNYGMFFHTASITVANGTSGSALLSTTAVANGVSIVSGSRITIENPGYYNIQFSAQLAQGVGAANYYLWFKKNGANIANSTSVKTLSGTSNSIMTVDIIDYATTAGDYYEIVHQSNASNSSLEYIAASGNYPAAPSLIVTVQQVR